MGAAFLLVLPWVIAAAPARAAIGPRLVTFGEPGSGAGQLDTGPANNGEGSGGEGGGIAADPDTGHIFISEFGNHRISEFTAWGEFVKAWGWGVANGNPELQTCTTACQTGVRGAGAGQLNMPNGIALDEDGNVYVFERFNRRVQVFSPTGAFLRMFGGSVNQTTGEDVCTAAQVEGGDTCGQGVSGTGPSEFSVSNLGNKATAGDYIDIALDGTVYVGDRDRIQTFETSGTFLAEIDFTNINETNSEFPATGDPGSLAIDGETGDIYFAFGHSLEDAPAFRLSPTGTVSYRLPTIAPEALTSGLDEVLYVADDPEPGFDDLPQWRTRVLEVIPPGVVTDSCCIAPVGSTIRGMTANVVTTAGEIDLYLLSTGTGGLLVEVRGPAPTKWAPPPAAPAIEDQFAITVTENSATLGAEINPNFWSDSRYYLEYGTSDCSLGGCQKVPSPPGNLLGGGVIKGPVATDEIELSGLQPDTTYHYRFVARSSGGGPTFGETRTFTTFPLAATADKNCSNQVFRTGMPSDSLDDCRAYEMVSPVDKLGGDILVLCNSLCLPAGIHQAAPSGSKLTYSSYRAFADAESAGYITQYLATRGSGGWSTDAISPPRRGITVIGGASLDSEYRAFLEDLSSGWFVHDTGPELAPGAVEGFANLYRRNNLSGAYEAVTTAAPSNQIPNNYFPEVQGFSADGKRSIFSANGKLTNNASSSNIRQIYELVGGTLRLVSIRPNGAASGVDSTVGSTEGLGGSGTGRAANLTHAVSEDGLRIYWTEVGGFSRLFVRLGGTKTVAVSATAATFWGATPDGSEAIYTESGNLRLFDLDGEASVSLASGVQGVMGASEDLSRIYFVSTDALAPGASGGEPNLYLYQEGASLTFIAELSDGDLQKEPAMSPVSLAPWRHAARVTPDGSAAVFMSRASLTGADNHDVNSGRADAEVFRYDSMTQEVLCISCIPTGGRPAGEEYEPYPTSMEYWYASFIRGWEMQLHAPRVLSDDGGRVFFDSFNQLVPSDTNGKRDVYQWEALGRGKCTDSNPRYRGVFGGCVSLISDGKGGHDSEFVDASSDGRDVFFTTSSSLVSQDPGQVDIYDAREGGGFPAPFARVECEGEACQQAAAPPPPPPVTSQEFSGPGNPKPKHHCKKGFVRKHGKCVRKHNHHKKKPKTRRSAGGHR